MTEYRVCDVDAVELGSVAAFDVETDGTTIAIALIRSAKDHWYAMDDRCSHGRFKMSLGEVDGDGIECTRHGSVFDLETGDPLNPPASSPIKTYDVRVDGETVYVVVE